MRSAEFQAMLELLAMLFFDWRTGVLILLLVIAAIYDLRSHRIPNRLVLAGLLFGAIYNTAFPPTPHDSVLFPLSGVGLALLVFLPLYLMRAMGAGDVKLMAMAGAFLGPTDIFYAMLASMVTGGIFALCYVLAKGTATRMWRNLVSLLQHSLLSTFTGGSQSMRIETNQSAGKLPYGVAIAIGTGAYLIMQQLGFL